VTGFELPNAVALLARQHEPEGIFGLPMSYLSWNVAAGGAMVVLGLAAFLLWRRRRTKWRSGAALSIRLFGVFAMGAGIMLLFGVHAHEPISRTSPIEGTRESVEMGREVFVQNCAACHGPEGDSDGPAAPTLPYSPPRLGDHVRFHGDRALFLWISEGLPPNTATKVMPPFGERLTEPERWHLVNFLRETFPE